MQPCLRPADRPAMGSGSCGPASGYEWQNYCNLSILVRLRRRNGLHPLRRVIVDCLRRRVDVVALRCAMISTASSAGWNDSHGLRQAGPPDGRPDPRHRQRRPVLAGRTLAAPAVRAEDGGFRETAPVYVATPQLRDIMVTEIAAAMAEIAGPVCGGGA